MNNVVQGLHLEVALLMALIALRKYVELVGMHCNAQNSKTKSYLKGS
jgi:hypothetical protein